jgi:hypothetical protein
MIVQYIRTPFPIAGVHAPKKPETKAKAATGGSRKPSFVYVCRRDQREKILRSADLTAAPPLK